MTMVTNTSMLFKAPKSIFLRCTLSSSTSKFILKTPTVPSLISSLKSCSSSHSIKPGQSLHAFAFKSCHVSNHFVLNSLINFYGKCGLLEDANRLFEASSTSLDIASYNTMLVNYVKFGRLEDAQELFDGMLVKDCVSYTTMIMGFSQNGSSDKALILVRDMMLDGIMPNDVTLATLLSACCGSGNLGKVIHGLALKTSLDQFVFVGTNLVNWYVVNFKLKDARRIFDSMCEKNTVTWNVILNGYSKSGLINMAEDLFKMIPNKDMISWSTLVDAYLKVNMLEKAFAAFRGMLRQDVHARPNEVLLVDLVSTCSKHVALREGSELHAVIVKAGLDYHSFVQATLINFYAACGKIEDACMLLECSSGKETVSCWNALLSGYVKNGMIDYARNLFHEMPCRDVVSWSSMISGYVEYGHPVLALELSYDMMMRYGIMPNDITLVSIFTAIASCGTTQQGKSAHGYIMKNNCIVLTDNLLAALLDMYAKRGDVTNALKAFTYHEKDASLSTASPWNALICGLATHGHVNTCLKIFSDMQKRKNVKPNPITFLGVLSACCHTGLVSLGREYFESMTSLYGIKPSIKHYGCMVDLLGRAGCLEEAERLIMDMPMKADVVIWGSTLAAARMHGKTEIGERAAERLTNIEPGHGGGRVLMSNIYADAGRWDDMYGVRRYIEEERLMKVPGCSGAH